MSGDDEEQLSRVKQQVAQLLHESADGFSEHALLKLLKQRCPDTFPLNLSSDSHSLYRAHFLLFHILYQLRGELLAEATGVLEIDVLCIRLRPYVVCEGGDIGVHDAMADYYLDLSHMVNTGPEEVEELLGAFWSRYYANGQRQQALAVLGLADPVDLDQVQQRYRQLAMQHHPDRGGDTEHFQALQQALTVLRRSQ